MRPVPPLDRRAVARVAALLGGAMRVNPELHDIEINPLVVYPAGVVALDALMIAAE